jgi:hypothetical protein
MMMDRGTVRNMLSFISKKKFEKLVHLAGFIIRKENKFQNSSMLQAGGTDNYYA